MKAKQTRELKINNEELKKIIKNIELKSPHPKKVKIIAITKEQGSQAIKAAQKEKLYNIGESRIQELEKKLTKQTKKKNLKIHLIGHLQRNKAKKAVKLCHYIQTVDSIKIAKKINEEALKINKKQKIYLQVNIGNDPNKHGFDKKEILKKGQEIKKMLNVEVVGIMTILPEQRTFQQKKKLFLETKKIQIKIKKTVFKNCKEVSMGMSGDYKEALESGATNIRIGTRLYGKRK